ncbi:hypothetical protein AMAG_02801 [Allomyces macrogynus ATCC 38327]|uniref:Myb-like domain-containing protein n=1 Tax=Allomyces macrogynus (strain ATCC 38327) TaxID=578462 RepID=A0A0L0S3C9_ALLM3|nr:hypothetical protein AMAG_02801 [Allomyces macrogynus ATCC 38327]|eukprot:KNE57042.1 hypothetical protein AMAG_02801 [Allomyces macrogynus ATCC 38327]
MPPTPRPTRADRTRAATGTVAAPPSRSRAVPASSLSGTSSAGTSSEGAPAGTLADPLTGTTNNIDNNNNDTAIPAVGTQARPRQRKPWTEIEVEALLQGVKKYGIGGWVSILSDPDLAFDARRTSVDLKDKWRVLTTRRSRRSKGPLIDFASLPRAYKPHGARARAPRLPLTEPEDAPAGTGPTNSAATPAASGSASASSNGAGPAPRAAPAAGTTGQPRAAAPAPAAEPHAAPAHTTAAQHRGPVDPPVPWPAAPALPCGSGPRSGSCSRTHASRSPPAIATAADAHRTRPHLRDGSDRAWPYPSSRDTWAVHPYWPPPPHASSAAAAAARAARAYHYPPPPPSPYAAYPGAYGIPPPTSPHDGYDVARPPRLSAMRPPRRAPDHHHGYPGSPIEHDLPHTPPLYPFFDPYAYSYYAPPPPPHHHGYPVPPPPAGYRAPAPVGVRSPPESFWEYPAYPAGGPRMLASASPTEWPVPGWRGGEHAHADRMSVDGGRVA